MNADAATADVRRSRQLHDVRAFTGGSAGRRRRRVRRSRLGGVGLLGVVVAEAELVLHLVDEVLGLVLQVAGGVLDRVGDLLADLVDEVAGFSATSSATSLVLSAMSQRVCLLGAASRGMDGSPGEQAAWRLGPERRQTRQETPVAWSGQYPPGFLARYCWWYGSA